MNCKSPHSSDKNTNAFNQILIQFHTFKTSINDTLLNNDTKLNQIVPIDASTNNNSNNFDSLNEIQNEINLKFH